MMNPYIPRAVRVIGIKEEAPQIKTFILDCVAKGEPDEFLEVSIPGAGECPISISSAPGEYTELTIRNVGAVTSKIHETKVGSFLFIRGPYGHGIPIGEFKGKNITLVGGGSGIAPLRGFIRHIEKNRDAFGELRLFFGFRTPRDIVFKNELEDWKEKFPTFVTVDTADEAWRGSVGLITRLIKEKGIKDNSAAVLCGPPTMMALVANLFKEEFSMEERHIWVSLERYMKCGIGKCGHCRIESMYVCQDGPVVNYTAAKGLID